MHILMVLPLKFHDSPHHRDRFPPSSFPPIFFNNCALVIIFLGGFLEMKLLDHGMKFISKYIIQYLIFPNSFSKLISI